MQILVKRFLVPALLSFVIPSCSSIHEDIRIILNAAGDNRPELEKVISHYKSSGEKEKLKASYFLIGNMDNKYALGGEELRKYDPIFEFFKYYNDKKLQITAASVYINNRLDSLYTVYGPFNKGDKKVVPDFGVMKAEGMISDIDLAFEIKNSTPWGRKMSFEAFCEHLLSYRFNHEPLEDWRSFYRSKYRQITDTLKKDSIKHLAEAIHKNIPRVSGSGFFMKYPFDFWLEQMETSRTGTCVQIATYRAQLFRSAGIPTAIDFTLCWGNHSAGHTWNTIMAEDGKKIHYEGTALKFGQELVYSVAKVYRKTFGRQETGFGKYEKEIPPEVRKDHMIDVTQEYTKTADISIELNYKPEKRKRYAVICSHNNKVWVPQDYGKIRFGKANFKNMGTGNLYSVMYYEEEALTPASDPFILNEKGEVVFITPDENKPQNMRILRKYPFRKSIQTYHEGVVGCHFQGANREDFRDSVILHTITRTPEHIVPAEIKGNKKFRYVRFKSPLSFKGDVAEVEFYGGDNPTDTLKLSGKVIGFPEVPKTFGTLYQNALDGNIDTYFHGYWASKLWWAGLDLGKAKYITKIRYCPRSDTNFIVEGDRYELCRWNKDHWVSMGEQMAVKPFLDYKNVPTGGLYILHNLSRGKEERVFTWEEGKQVFW